MKQTIEVYTFNIRKHGGHKNLSFSTGKDVYELMKTDFVPYIDTVKTGPVDGLDKRTLKIQQIINGNNLWGFDDDKRYVYGVLESGLYGKQLKIVNKNDPRHILYDATDRNAALIKPFFFLVFIPRFGDTAFIVLERTDNESIRGLFQMLLESFLREKLTNEGQEQKYKIKLSNYLSYEYVENLKNGKIKSVKLSLSRIPDDLARLYMLDGLDADTSMSLTLSFKGGLFPDNKVSKAIKDGRIVFSSDALNTLFNESETTIVTESDVNGVSKSRTVYLSGEAQNHIRPYYIIDVEENERGYSEYNSIRDAVYTFIDSNEELVAFDGDNEDDE